MGKSTINLASQKKEVTTRVFRKVFLYSFVIFIAVFISTLGLVSYNLFLKTRLSQKQAESDELKQQVSTLSSTEAKITALRERVSAINQIFTAREDVGSKVLSILSVIPQGAVIDSLDASSELLTIKILSNNLLSISSLMEDGVISLSKNKSYGIKKTDMSSFKADPKSGAYSLSLSFFFNTKKIVPLQQKPIELK